MDNLTNQRQCPECERPIFGRADKKFCSDACRNAFNNRMNSDTTNFVRNVNNTLRKNRRILLDLQTLGKAKIHRDKLLKAGFDFDFFTNTYETKIGEIYKYCYDQGYLILDDGYLMLTVKQNFPE
ncbi:hypothetical protein N7E81_09020 [Reichenbachiella carrageenanivorans]|uniref:DUF2116 family Zn-ribbon domain-containing protein n=1 Tax=Reichenbachiella carrageenanivorans TaxID=2979869 RepID=A0ABY6D518_9BACT|nr:hypothetical protein [Reichenbachiella carrageenanivorans]UXX81236.1 hypothetical protein N7E81_09020 [Reichenbachiella carrageenanivorans]